MADDSFQEKTEKATPKRRGEARDEGNVARSMEINTAVILLVGTLTLYIIGPWLTGRIRLGIVTTFRESAHLNLTVDNLCDYTFIALKYMLTIVAPLALIILVFGIAVNVMQTGLMFSPKSLQPKFSKLNPIEGIKRLFSMRSMVELVKSILKISIVGYFAYSAIKGDFDKYYLLMDSDIGITISFIGKLAFKLVLKITLVLLILAILDYIYQKWDYEKKLRMSKQDIKEEAKQSEGDPQVKGKIRSMQRQMVINAMIQDLPQADVIVTNPVHLAVALKYDSEAMSAPKVVAKGARKMAERIKQIAAQHDIPIVENKELARALYKFVDVGMEVPSKLFQAVAEVLSYVYQLKNKKAF